MALTVTLIVLDPYFASASAPPRAGSDATTYMFSNLSHNPSNHQEIAYLKHRAGESRIYDFLS
jgi:hypothetical protein